MKRIALAALLLCVADSATFAETPASQPSVQTYPALQKKLAEQKAEIDRLKLAVDSQRQEIEKLRAEKDAADKKLAALTPAPPGARIKIPDDGKFHPELVKVGIDRDDAIALLGGPVYCKLKGQTAKTSSYTATYLRGSYSFSVDNQSNKVTAIFPDTE